MKQWLSCYLTKGLADNSYCLFLIGSSAREAVSNQASVAPRTSALGNEHWLQ